MLDHGPRALIWYPDGMPIGAGVIQELVAPAVMISACGLLCLSTNARMMSVIGRLRGLYHDQVAAFVDEPGENPRKKAARQARLEGVAWQSRHVLARLQKMRWTMMLLFGATLAMLVCSACIGLNRVIPGFDVAAVASFALGGLLMAAAMVVSIVEMNVGLRALEDEHQRINALADGPALSAHSSAVPDTPRPVDGVL